LFFNGATKKADRINTKEKNFVKGQFSSVNGGYKNKSGLHLLMNP
jgi:hypothetical protein